MYIRRLKDLRDDHDLTQEQIANYLRISRVVYNRYERGIRDIPVELLIELSKLYNTSIDYIVGRTDIKEFKRKKDNYSHN